MGVDGEAESGGGGGNISPSYLVSSNPSAGGDEGVIRREDTDDLLDEETLPSPRPAGDEDIPA